MKKPMKRLILSDGSEYKAQIPMGTVIQDARIIGYISRQSTCFDAGTAIWTELNVPTSAIMATACTGSITMINAGAHIRLAPKPVKPRIRPPINPANAAIKNSNV